MPVPTPVPAPGSASRSCPESVHVRIGGRWVAGQALSRRTPATGVPEVLVGHHGHLLWVDQSHVRRP